MLCISGVNSKSFVDLVAWQKAHELVLSIYRLTRAFPKDELFCLTSQMRRAAVSVPANIAEGFKRRGRQDKLRFLNIAQRVTGRVALLFDSDNRS
jgi:four helix bundle protein